MKVRIFILTFNGFRPMGFERRKPRSPETPKRRKEANK